MPAPVVALIFLAGLAIGSFLNVVAYRLPRGESLAAPPSHCPNCDTPIRWHDNVPVLGWLLLRGRCRACGEPISWRYPAVELGDRRPLRARRRDAGRDDPRRPRPAARDHARARSR